MSSDFFIEISRRENTKTHIVRKNGLIPAVLYEYKDSQRCLNVSVPYKQIEKELISGRLTRNVYKINLDKKEERIIIRELQFHPVSDRILHLDLILLKDASKKVQVDLPLKIIGRKECIGLRNKGLLNIVRPKISVLCDINKIPQEIVIDISKLDIGESVHVADIEKTQGISIIKKTEKYPVVSIISAKGNVKEEDKAEETSEENKS